MSRLCLLFGYILFCVILQEFKCNTLYFPGSNLLLSFFNLRGWGWGAPYIMVRFIYKFYFQFNIMYKPRLLACASLCLDLLISTVFQVCDINSTMLE